jgi:prepilin-type N-terminal cleavage/methylation domain-containing protein
MKSDRRAGAEAGFTLVEVLIATAIFSFSIGALFAVYSNVVIASAAAAERATARLHLQSLLAEIGVTRPLTPQEQSGRFGDGYSWRVAIEPFMAEGAAAPVAAWSVTASVDWSSRGKARSLSLSTLKLGGGEES